MKIPAIESASVEEMHAFQVKALQETLLYVNTNSPFYAEHFRKHQISPQQIRTLPDLSLIPTVSKDDLQKRNKDFYCVPPGRIIDYCSTSGTEGEAVTIPLSERDMERLGYNEALSLACAGGSENELYQLATTIDRRFMAGLAYTLGARKLGAGMIRVGSGLPALHWKTIEDLQPTALITVPSFLLRLIDYAEQYGINFNQSSIKKAICIGEPIRRPEDTFALNALGERIKEKWDIELYSTYASTEMGTAFTECSVGRGGHAHPELVITELLDTDGLPVKPGEPGELTITTLGVESMPLVRFKTGDICREYTEPCSCGRNTSRLGPVIGRKNQMIKYKGTTLYPPALFDVMDSMPYVTNYVIEVYANTYGMDEVLVRYHADKDFNPKELSDRFRVAVRVAPRLIATSPEELNALTFPKMSRKPVKFIDKRTG